MTAGQSFLFGVACFLAGMFAGGSLAFDSVRDGKAPRPAPAAERVSSAAGDCPIALRRVGGDIIITFHPVRP